jgi:NADPH2:quinone reductase
MAATGGVGGYAVQMARSRGAHVIATVRGDVDEARRLGAQEAYDTDAVDVIDAVRAAHPDGVDAVLDLVNGPRAIGRDADILKRGGGRLVSTIFAADEKWFAERHITAHNHASSKTPLISPQGLSEVARMLGEGTITARVRSTVELDGAEKVLSQLRSGGVRGKGRHLPLTEPPAPISHSRSHARLSPAGDDVAGSRTPIGRVLPRQTRGTSTRATGPASALAVPERSDASR